jgi:hypothetical protein
MSETKFGVLASLCYLLAFVSAAAAVIFTVSGSSVMRVDTGLYAAAAIVLIFWGFVFHAFHTSTLRRDALLTEIRDLLAIRRGAPKAAEPETAEVPDGLRDKAWGIGKR